MLTASPSSSHRVTASSAGIEGLLRLIDEGGSHVALLSGAKVGISETAAFFDDRLEDFANDRREADRSELPWICCAGGFATGIL